MSNPIKSNLFRFVTLRNPQLIDEEAKNVGFIEHPDKTQSVFYEAVKDLEDSQKRAALQTASDAFTAYKTRTEVRTAFSTLYTFSSWLMRNKNDFSFVSVLENTTGVQAFTAAEEITVWDNLIYQTVNKESVYVREATIQLLIANRFLRDFLALSATVASDYVFSEEELKRYKRKAHSSVVISKTLFVNETTSTSTNGNVDTKKFDTDLDNLLAKDSIEKYKALTEELKKVEQAHIKETEVLYKAAEATHKADVENIITNATPTYYDRKDDAGNTISRVKTYPDLVLPEFTFDDSLSLDESFLKQKLTADSWNLMNEQGLDVYNEFSDLYNAINIKSKKAYETVLNHQIAKKGKTVKVGGVTVNLAKTATTSNCFTAVYTQLPTGEQGILMQLATSYSGAYVTAATSQLTYATNPNVVNGLDFQNMSSDATSLTVFFNYDLFLYGEGSEMTLTGQITLDNGDVHNFDVSTIVARNYDMKFKGCTTSTGTTTGSTTNTNEVFGVTKLGIADFRRVEQEVCCYVPGEVSHIENILAREYKERQTRNLNSAETTSETSSESEIENLSDTTTTERNEMQSEVSSVLNEDESSDYGASASVNGDFGKIKFNTDAFANFSSSSATSNSNSDAQTYAQEVTDRAMERVIQKISRKRTSRILKEFEEKNTHGFDNTKGEKHVTGIYRWVDKIYKNSLINYGKRLMYEFAIPEPAKFFKQALIKQLEVQDTPPGMILPDAPEHPSVYDILTPSDLHESNYQTIAAYYNAEVTVPPLEYKSMGKSFSYTITNTDSGEWDEIAAENEDVEIPEGYCTKKAKARWAYSNDGGGGTFHVIVGEKLMANNSETNIGEYVDTIPVSFSQFANLSGSVNVKIKLQRLPEFYAQWQNETYTAIVEAYEEKLRQYNDAMQSETIIESSDTETIRFNPLYNRSLEKREIKRIAIELLAEQKGIDVSQNNYGLANETTSISKVRKNAGLQSHASIVKFFEQAFDWEIMAYKFYPYFYADERNWVELFQSTDAADPLFQAFLQSGMARTVVPVRKGFEDAVNWYMETGELWNGQGLVIDQDDDLYVSVADEMQTIEGKVEGTWETRLPTSLTIVQAQSASLDEGGLPCFCEDEQTGNTINPSESLIGGDAGVSTGGIGKFIVSE